MVTMDDISNAIISLVRIGAAARFIYCMVRLSAAEEEAASIRNEPKTRSFLYYCRKHLADQRLGALLLCLREDENG